MVKCIVPEGRYTGIYVCTITRLFPSLTGPPVITYNNGSIHTFHLLPSDTNRAEIEVLTLNVILSVNLVGRWQTPDGSFVIQNSLSLPIFYLSDEGLYKFYVTDWNGEQELAIQIDISVIGEFICLYTLT